MIRKNLYRTFALLFLVTVIACGTALASPPTISIAEARSLPLGTVVTIDGAVTVPSGAFSSSTFDQGFAIQDRTAGIYVSTPDNLGFAPRQQVRVTGTLADTVLPGLLVLVDGPPSKHTALVQRCSRNRLRRETWAKEPKARSSASRERSHNRSSTTCRLGSSSSSTTARAK